MTTFFADTNIFLRFLLGDVPAQYKIARKYLEAAKNLEIEIVVCPMVLAEVTYALTKFYEFDKISVIDKLETIVNNPYLEVEERPILQETLSLYLKNDFDLVDCYLSAKAKLQDGKVLSFDKDLKKLPT